jgi:hypothetical protein
MISGRLRTARLAVAARIGQMTVKPSATRPGAAVADEEAAVPGRGDE